MAFSQATWKAYKPAEHLAKLAAYLGALDQGRVRRLLVTMPPRHGKSELCSVRFPAWLIGRNPDHQYVIASYAADLATRFSREVRNIVASREFQFVFPGIVLAEDSKAVDSWAISGRKGGIRAVGVGGGLTGYGAHGIVIDDPVKSRAEAESETYRDSVWQWYRSVVYTRLEPGGWIALIMTRWHEDDLAGRILRQMELDPAADRWTVLHMPALDENEQPLWPERFSVEELERIRANVGQREWESLYQGRPRPTDGALFKREWFRVVDAAPDGLKWARYWDLAASTRTTGDYTASARCAIGPDGVLYIADIIRGRWEWPDARRIIIQTALSERDVTIGIESTGFQLAAVQDIFREPSLVRHAVKPITVDKDKTSRALPWAARAEAGKVALVSGEWVNRFIDECVSYPVGAHDDQVDAVSGAVEMVGEIHEVEFGPPIW